MCIRALWVHLSDHFCTRNLKADDQRDGGDLEFVEDCISIPKNEIVPIQEIIEVFRDETLNKIPKIFFIQVPEKLDHLVYN